VRLENKTLGFHFEKRSSLLQWAIVYFREC
jgi:hypothetical protein